MFFFYHRDRPFTFFSDLFLMGKEPNVEATNERIITQQNVAESTNDFEQTKMINRNINLFKVDYCYICRN